MVGWCPMVMSLKTEFMGDEGEGQGSLTHTYQIIMGISKETDTAEMMNNN